jgi:hypothetical protein
VSLMERRCDCEEARQSPEVYRTYHPVGVCMLVTCSFCYRVLSGIDSGSRKRRPVNRLLCTSVSQTFCGAKWLHVNRYFADYAYQIELGKPL